MLSAERSRSNGSFSEFNRVGLGNLSFTIIIIIITPLHKFYHHKRHVSSQMRFLSKIMSLKKNSNWPTDWFITYMTNILTRFWLADLF